MGRVGVFVCTGCGIGASLRTDGFESLAKESGAARLALHPALCAPEGQELLRQAAASGAVDALVIAGCSARHKRLELSFDPEKMPVERVVLREQVTWSHPAGEEDTQMLAEDLLRMGVARAATMKPAERAQETIEPTVLVVGGGLAGLNAALAASGLGHPVVLVEKATRLGGYLTVLKQVVPDVPPYDRLHANPIPELVREIEKDTNIRVLLATRVKEIAGQPGQFAVELEGNGDPITLKVGAIVQATGARPYDASRLSHLGYGQKGVLTTAELDRRLADGSLTVSGSGAIKRVAFIQCAGSRDAQHLPYCSTDCCAASLRQVLQLREAIPGVECSVVFRDLRTPGQLERFYQAVQDRSGVLLVRGEVESVAAGGDGLRVGVSDSLLGEAVEIEADLVVLATGMVPVSADGEAIRQLRDAKKRIEKNESETQRKAAEALAASLAAHEGTEILNLSYRQGPDLPVLAYGFPDSHYICFPYETRRTGVYTAGCVRAPMGWGQAAEDGWGAAMKAVQAIVAARQGEAVHPRSGDVGFASFFLQRCTQCKRCTEECPVGAIDEDPKGTPQYNKLRCRRCGICLGACPERIISYPDYSVDGIASMIKAIEVPEEDEEKPRILALLCENDALPALDDAAMKRTRWNPWVRVIPVRCLGSVNIIWISEALSRGIDGVVLVGCKRGADYQCHFIQGSELANKRMENLQETLTRLSLESERVRVVELGRDEWDRIPAVLDDFAKTLDDLGLNPLKGF